ncbi:hypothetical protein COHA_008650 [Chlorella ohadii]|uniref:Uncharacterized protein n=1 Tax=Chlorella ohadii TaxID=2649997 RepID=A0AAD5GYT1_9CHLO|nr:hypothetical protein COHA_008650 [Chlorella ohadii]
MLSRTRSTFSVSDLANRHFDDRRMGAAPPPPRVPGRAVWWHAPFFSGSGMGTEALQLVLGLDKYTEYTGRVWVSSHGDLDSYEVFNGLDSGVQRRLVGMVRAAEAASWEDARSAITVCHSEPGAWALPHPLYETRPCPPVPVEEAAYVVARAMFESDRLSNLHVERCNKMHEVWVPTEFHRHTFAASGVQPAKLQVVPEPVDTAFFDPTKHKPLPLPLGLRVFGPAWPHSQAAESRTAAGSVAAAVAGQQAGGSGAAQADGGKGGGQAEPFVFLAVFKWEARKASIGAIVGWDVLLRAFLSAFTAADNVMLLLHTKPFHSEPDFPQQMQAACNQPLVLQAWARKELGETMIGDASRMPSVYVLSDHIPQSHFPRLYKSADCFVLPTRGPTAYLDDTVGYPLTIDGLVTVGPDGGAFAGELGVQAA